MAVKLLAVLVATLLASASARSLRLPEARFASLEGFTEDADDAGAARAPRHLLDFAEFDRPLSPDPSPQHHRRARGAEDAAPPCDCADNPDLVPEIVETAPVAEGPFCHEFDVPQQQQVVYELVEAPEERAGVELTADDAQLADDQEATLCDEGLHPEDEADVEPCAGRPARQLEAKAVSEASSEEKSAESSEEDKKEAGAAVQLEDSKVVKAEVEGSEAGASEDVAVGAGGEAKAIESEKAEASADVVTGAGAEAKVSASEKAEASEDVAVGAVGEEAQAADIAVLKAEA